jgi:hypothetical protein
MKHPLVEAGLRALREEVPTEESKRATLARLGIGDVAPATPPAAAAPPVARVGNGALLWLLLGVLLGAIVLLLRHW